MRSKILYETFILFSEKGYDTSMSEIASRVGLKRTALYNYFTQKDELLKEVIIREIEKRYASETSIFDHYAGNSSETRLKVIYYTTLEYAKDMHTLDFWRQLRNVSNANIKEYSTRKIILKDERFAREVSEIISEGYANGEITYTDLKGVFNLYKTLVYGVLYFVRTDNDSNIFDDYAANVWHTYWNLVKS